MFTLMRNGKEVWNLAVMGKTEGDKVQEIMNKVAGLLQIKEDLSDGDLDRVTNE